jgi:hypothetical protein
MDQGRHHDPAVVQALFTVLDEGRTGEAAASGFTDQRALL